MRILLLAALLLSFTTSNSQLPTPITLPNGWSLSPLGRTLQLGDLPLNMAVSHSGKRMAVSNNGQSGHSIQYIDVVNPGQIKWDPPALPSTAKRICCMLLQETIDHFISFKHPPKKSFKKLHWVQKHTAVCFRQTVPYYMYPFGEAIKC